MCLPYSPSTFDAMAEKAPELFAQLENNMGQHSAKILEKSEEKSKIVEVSQNEKPLPDGIKKDIYLQQVKEQNNQKSNRRFFKPKKDKKPIQLRRGN